MSSAKLDVVIFGASGYTGKYTVYEAVKVLGGLKWGVAGRNRGKIEAVLKEMGKKAGEDLSKIPIIIADINDQVSLVEMAKQAKVIVNCCGPYRFFGESMVKACIEAGAHQVDVSGEPQFMETMQLKYHDIALKKGVYMISACGFDSIPADIGTNFLEQEFNGTLNQVETYLKSYPIDKKLKTKGSQINYGTYETAVHAIANAGELRGLRNKLFPKRLPRFNPPLKARSVMHRAEVLNGKWCLPFPGSDRSVVMRSQRHMFDVDNKRPVQMRAYVSFPGFLSMLAVLIGVSIFGILSQFSLGRKLLLNYPKLCTFGAVSHEGPEEKTNENAKFDMYFYGQGWKEKMSNDEINTRMNKKMITRVSAVNPGYGATCIALLLSATTILKESNKMPFSGGVLPPGAAFRNTNMIEDLKKNGFTFEVLKVEE